MLDASYEPPGGLVGAALDSVALHQVAHHTLQLLVDVADRLAAEMGWEPTVPGLADVGSPGQFGASAPVVRETTGVPMATDVDESPMSGPPCW